jgi:hypothetical protein
MQRRRQDRKLSSPIGNCKLLVQEVMLWIGGWEMVSFILWLILKRVAYINSEAKLSDPVFFSYSGEMRGCSTSICSQFLDRIVFSNRIL